LAKRSHDDTRAAAFLDRDGTINEDVDFLADPRDLRLLPGAAEAIAMLRRAGYLVIVVSNQSGIARGYFDEATLAAIHDELRRHLRAEGADVDAIYWCPHLPEGQVERYAVACGCRKPEPGLLLRAAAEWRIDLTRSVMIGDAERDVEAGRRAGCRTALLAVEPPRCTVADVVVPSLREAARWAVEMKESEP